MRPIAWPRRLVRACRPDAKACTALALRHANVVRTGESATLGFGRTPRTSDVVAGVPASAPSRIEVLMHSSSVIRVSLPLLLGIAACATSGGQQDAPEQKEQLVTWIEKVHMEAERARQSIGDSFQRLNVIAAGDFSKEPAAMAYAKFVQATDLAEQQAKRFREAVGPMLASGQPVFEKWQAEVKAITNERLRQRGEMRFSLSKERYEAITKSAVPARDQFDAFVKALRDHAAFLAHDLNATAIDEIQEEVKQLARNARELDRQMDSCEAATRAFAEEQSLPAAPGR
jgi:hypothetical protein